MRILIVEDDATMADIVRQGLEDEGFATDLAERGSDAIALVETNSYDLVLMDIILPEMDGLGVIQAIRQRGIQTPVICLSSKDEPADKVAGLDIGADDYLAKPFDFSELLARCRALLRRQGSERGAEILFADIRLDPVEHRVWRADREIELTTREYALLEFMMRHPNEPLNRKFIAENVWVHNFDSYTNVIDVYINYLRNKIDRNQPKKLIHTVRGQGYMLKEV